MKLPKEKVEAWFDTMNQIGPSMYARYYLMPFVMAARVWDEIDVPQVAGKLVDQAVEADRHGDERAASFLIDAASELRRLAKEQPQ